MAVHLNTVEETFQVCKTDKAPDLLHVCLQLVQSIFHGVCACMRSTKSSTPYIYTQAQQVLVSLG